MPTLTVERELPHPPEKVWRALTEGALIAQWLMRNDFQPVVGHRFTLRTDPMPHWDGIVDCEVLTVQPLTSLSYAWNTTAGLQTVVTWTLQPSAAGTLLRMEQSGFPAEADNNFRGAQYGWPRFLDRLDAAVAALSE